MPKPSHPSDKTITDASKLARIRAQASVNIATLQQNARRLLGNSYSTEVVPDEDDEEFIVENETTGLGHITSNTTTTITTTQIQSQKSLRGKLLNRPRGRSGGDHMTVTPRPKERRRVDQVSGSDDEDEEQKGRPGRRRDGEVQSKVTGAGVEGGKRASGGSYLDQVLAGRVGKKKKKKTKKKKRNKEGNGGEVRTEAED